MSYKVYETHSNGSSCATFEADDLNEAVEIVARERDNNIGSTYNGDNTFRVVELTETEVPIRISIGGSGERGAIATSGDVTVTA